MPTLGSRVMPVDSLTSNHHFEALDPDSYTAHKLKHASPEHLHLTSRRFFIGPIPEGWLDSNRKTWYKRRLELSTYSSRRQSFNAAAGVGPHHKTLGGLGGLSTAARMSFSFPQPEDVEDSASESEDTHADEDGVDEDDGEDRETLVIEPVSTVDAQEATQATETAENTELRTGRRPPDGGIDGAEDLERLSPSIARHQARGARSVEAATKSPDRRRLDGGQQQGTQTPDASPSHPPSTVLDDFDATSREPLIEPGGPSSEQPDRFSLPNRSMQKHAPAPIHDDEPGTHRGRTNTGVRFKVSEGLAERRHRINRRVDSARGRVASKHFHRNTLREGTIVKMEKMLVKIEFTQQGVPSEFDENESMKIETRTLEKWREFMVVARKSSKQNEEDFRLQIYKTRVIPEIDNESTSKKPAREIRLNRKTTHVNLYSSLDKTVVLWHPYRKGTRIIIMRATSTAHSVEWFTFLRDAMGWRRPTDLRVSVPDLDLTLRLEKPFDNLELATLEAKDEETAMAKTVAAEQAVAGLIVSRCIEMLEKDPEWTKVLKSWRETARMGLAWKRYDRLEWIHGITEQKMYGSMAMQQTHDLELRPKEHYPTTARGMKGILHQEPPPIEGFLVRLTSQKGVHQRLGKTFFKRLYFFTNNQFLMFNRPAKATPPHPPRLATISGSSIPSANDIIEKTPETFDVAPFRAVDGRITWLSSGNIDNIKKHDGEALEEARRNLANLEEADGYVNLCRIRKVRKFQHGAAPVDENMDLDGSDSDVAFHAAVGDSVRPDGATNSIDADRTFELILDNGLLIRLQAYSQATRTEWIKRLRSLVKYWRLRIADEVALLKTVRDNNLKNLQIDEQMEAILGQFGRKWEVAHSEASPELYHMCGIASCRAITMSGLLYRKPRRRSTFQRCSVILSSGKLFIYQATLRKRTGEQVKHIHQERQEVIDLKDCYVYSGLLVEDDLLYQNRTFDPDRPGMAATPRVYLEDGWTSDDIDVMTCFVIWRSTKKGWFRSPGHSDEKRDTGKRAKLKRVGQLGVPGRGMVFKCRSRAERDHWVLSVGAEIERLVEQEEWEGDEEVRLDS